MVHGLFRPRYGHGRSNKATVSIGRNIESAKQPDHKTGVYTAIGKSVSIDLAGYFKDGEKLTYNFKQQNGNIADITINGTMLNVTGKANGTTHVTISNSAGQEQTIVVTVRKNAGENGWL